MELAAATKAFIRYQNKVLILKESDKYKAGTNSGKFDVVGGRIKPGERFDESLRREIKEETGLEVKIGRPFHVDEWRPIINGEQLQIVGTFFECESYSENVILSQDHEEFRWINPKEYKNYNLYENLKRAFEAYLNI